MAKKKDIDQLLEEQKKLQAQIKEARNEERKKERQRRERMMKIVGRYFLEQYEQDEQIDQLRQKLDLYLTNNTERKLFALDPLPPKPQTAESQKPEHHPSKTPAPKTPLQSDESTS